VLALGGLGLDGRSFSRLAPLAGERDLVLANIPNELPPAARMEDLAREAFGILDAAGHAGRPVVLMGSSLGGMVALAAALEAPTRAAGLVLLGAAASWSEVPARLRIASRLIPFIPRRPFPAVLAAFMVPPFKHPDPAVRNELRTQMLHRTKEYAHRALSAMRGFDARARLPTPRMPALVVHGGDDRVLPPRAGAALAAALPRATLHAMPGCGHLPHVSEPGPVVEALARFLAKEGL